MSVIDTFPGKMVATISVATGPHGMEISQDGNAVYVAGDGSSSLNVIDTASDRVTKTIEADKQPNGIALTPDGKASARRGFRRRPHRAGRYRDNAGRGDTRANRARAVACTR